MASRDSEIDPDSPQAIDVPSVLSENESEVEQGRGRKKPRKVKEWGSVSSKVKRSLGQSYVSYKTKKQVTARVIGNPCHDGCFRKVTEEGVNNIFSEFWALGSYDTQNAYIIKMVILEPVKRKRTNNEHSKRSNTRYYSVMINNVKIKVCNGFMAMHAIGTTRLTTALRKVNSTGMVIPNQRGRHEPANKIVGAKALHVREHIKLLSAMSCHYSRVNAPHRKYLESCLTTEKLFVSYMEWLRDTYPEEEKASLHYYSDVFTKEFKISFEQPRTDMCTTCDTFDVSIKNSNGDQAAVDDLIRQKEEHQQLAQQAQDFMKKIAEDNDPETCVSVSRRYKVVRMKQAMFLNVSVLQNHITKCQAPGRTFKDACKLLFCLNYKEGFIIKSHYASDNIYTEVRLMKGRAFYSHDRFNLSVVHLPPLYNNPIPLTEEKLRDL
ncbi:hypothetical protein Pcinc_010199 [Petrolisthes cinctipes]|uniref:Uncharacterized protein n=1 Tax=Petrolisthes cinctipes TaxID=88211 RepID=A0AAE1KVL1_PETCI|nr:hypothetical protein Pcinc_010199 [Petrolisthes cinctipes]